MENKLTPNQREYVLFHFAQTFILSDKIREHFIFGHVQRGRICFLENTDDLDISRIISKEACPILFPGDPGKAPWTLTDGTLVFHHDLLRSAFYLLSGQQEYGSTQKDSLGRFPYEGSLQEKLGIMHKPLVNYYFQWIAKGIIAYAAYHELYVNKRCLFNHFGLFLTHDVDRIDKYNFPLTKNQLKKRKVREFFRYAVKWLNPFDSENPYWTFDYFLEQEKKRGFISTYFFLNRGVKHIDSYYHFSQPKIKRLISHLQSQGCEIGMHGTVKSADDPFVLKKNLEELETAAMEKIQGNRQHRLTYTHPYTAALLEKSGIQYDSTLGFAAHEGFRNSYCLPFRLYDFEADRMLDLWEIPLLVMDGTLFDYRTLSYPEALASVEKLIKEIKHFHGVFTLLWHNSYCDEEQKSGIRAFYESLLQMLADADVESVTGKTIVERLHAQ